MIVAFGCGRNGDSPKQNQPTTSSNSSKSSTPSKSVKVPSRNLAKVILEPSAGKSAAVKVEVARTRRQIRQGLMFRQFMPMDQGMLFLMGVEEVHSFYMRNTFIPLDMIFIRKDMTVAGVVANATPQTETSRTVGEPSYYVLEVNAGWAAKHGVGKGTKVRFEGVKE
jgi:uncharacterized membrane protein (UPF0127 family)